MFRLISVIAMVLLLTSVQSSSAAAQQTSIRQKILPLDCVFEIVDSESGSIRYITPDECGVPAVPPEPTLPPIVNNPPAIQPEKANIGPVRYEQPVTSAPLLPLDVVINNFTTTRSYQSVLVRAVPGQIIHFRIPAGGLGSEYQTWSITVVDIIDSSIRLSTSSQEADIIIDLGQTVQLDIDSNGQQDINLKLDGIDPHNSANLRFWLVHDEADAITDGDDDFASWPYVVALAVAAMVIYILRRKGSALI